MTKRPSKLERDPPWMRLGPAADAPDEGDDGERLWKKLAEGVKPLAETKHGKHAKPKNSSPLEGEVAGAKPRTEGAPSAGTAPPRAPSADAGGGDLPPNGGGGGRTQGEGGRPRSSRASSRGSTGAAPRSCAKARWRSRPRSISTA